MSDYKTIQGNKIKILSADPSPVYEGQTWFNTTSNTLNVRAFPAGTWTVGGTVNTARRIFGGAAGTQTAGLIMGGETTAASALSEEYNGVDWTEGNDLNTARAAQMGFGIQTAAVCSGGSTGSAVVLSEEYDGSSYTEGNDLNTARVGSFALGTQTAGLIAGGNFITNSEEYNGTGYTEGNDLNAARGIIGCATAGTQTAGLGFSGYTSGPATWHLVNEEYNGTSWSEVADLSVGRYAMQGFGTSQDSAVVAGGHGSGGYIATTEAWNGTSWASATALPAARIHGGGMGTAAAGLVTAGTIAPANTDVTNEWTQAAETQTVTVS